MVLCRQLKEKQNHDLDTCGFNGAMQLVCCPQSLKKFGKNFDKCLRQWIENKYLFCKIFCYVGDPDDTDNTRINNRIFVRIAEKGQWASVITCMYFSQHSIRY